MINNLFAVRFNTRRPKDQRSSTDRKGGFAYTETQDAELAKRSEIFPVTFYPKRLSGIID